MERDYRIDYAIEYNYHTITDRAWRITSRINFFYIHIYGINMLLLDESMSYVFFVRHDFALIPLRAVLRKKKKIRACVCVKSEKMKRNQYYFVCLRATGTGSRE